ncbi:unnamed protein product [Urochloa humidicola]
MAVTSFLLILAIVLLAIQTCSINLPGPSANLSTVWTSMNFPPHGFYDTQNAAPALLNFVPGNSSLAFAAGFYCIQDSCATFLFGVYIVYILNDIYPQFLGAEVVWSANRNHLVQNATLNFTANGDLLMHDADGSLVWSTNTSDQSVTGITLTESGNLVLFDHNKAPIWQSFDHPTDCLLPGQQLVEGIRLTPNTSATEATTINLFLTVLADGLYAFAESSPPQLYYDYHTETRNGGKWEHGLINGSQASDVCLFRDSFSVYEVRV